ncbi:MAG: ROK family protein [Limnochordia bacterium]|jgi:glucokinase
MQMIGIDIGGTKCAVVSAALDGSIKHKIRFATETDRGLDYTLGRIYEAVDELLAAEPAHSGDPVFGISCGGPLDSRQGIILSPPNLPGWDYVPIVDLLTKRYGGQAFLMNDANACALAEWHFGAARGYRNVIFLTFGTGLGAGLILDGRLFVGSSDLAGEVGHIRLAETGPVGYGKAGSFEGFCSGGGIARMAQEEVKEAWQRGEQVSFCPSPECLDDLDAKAVSQAAADGDILAKRIMDRSAFYLGRGLSILIDLLNPDIIVIGSIYARCEQLLRPGALQVIAEEALPDAAQRCQVVPAALGESIGDYATIAAARYGLGLELGGIKGD